ncbi:hypothetical protein ABK040_008186 [Willaertia magna]
MSSRRLEEDDDFELQEQGRVTHNESHNDFSESRPSIESADFQPQKKTIGEKFISTFKCFSNIGALIIVLIILIVLGAFAAFAGVLFTKERSCGGVKEKWSLFSTVSLEQNAATYTDVKSKYSSVIAKLQKAADVMNDIYLSQVWSKNLEVRHEILVPVCNEKPRRLFDANFGPWLRVGDEANFIKEEFLAEELDFEIPEHKPPQAGFYPSNMTIDAFYDWLDTKDEVTRKKALSPYSLIKEKTETVDKQKQIVTYVSEYHEEYKSQLTSASNYLKDAANLLKDASDATLKNFLVKRADALLNSNYDDSDIAWLQVTDENSPLEVTIGPYETYDDGLLGIKASFEALIGYRDGDSSKKLKTLVDHLQVIQNNLPIESEYKNRTVGSGNTIRVINEIYAGGMAKSLVKAVAYNLPNTPHIIENYGAKRVILKNVQKAKFIKVLQPISKVVVDGSQLELVNFDAFFTHVVAHELMHGVGPQTVYESNTHSKTETPIREALGGYYSPLEEAKADAGGLWMLGYLINNDLATFDFNIKSADTQAPASLLAKKSIYVTFLASIFRSVRFGIDDSHAKSAAIIFNYLREKGGVSLEKEDSKSKFSINMAFFEDAVQELTGKIMTIQATGNRKEAESFLKTYAVESSEIQEVNKELKELEESGTPIPIDIVIQDSSPTPQSSTVTSSYRSFLNHNLGL